MKGLVSVRFFFHQKTHMYKALTKIECTLVARTRKRDGYKVGGPHHFSQGASTFFSLEYLS